MGAENPIGWSSFEEMMDDAIALIGGDVLALGMSERQKIAIMRRSLLWWASFNAPKRLAYFDGRGDNIFDMPEDCDTVLEVVTPPISEELFEIYGGGTGYSILYDPLPIAIFRGDYSYVLQILQDVEMGKRILSADMNWEYNRITRQLYVFPTGRNAPYKIGVFYLSSKLDFKDVDMLEQDTIFRKFQCEAKHTVGMMRRKYSEWPGPGGTITMDGDALVSEAIEERRELDEELAGRARPGGFIVG